MKILVFLLPLFRFLYLSKLQMLPSDIFLILDFYLSFDCNNYKVQRSCQGQSVSPEGPTLVGAAGENFEMMLSTLLQMASKKSFLRKNTF